MVVPLVGARRRLRVVAFSDLRVQSLDHVLTWLRQRRAQGVGFDLIVYAGDDIARFRPDDATNFFELWAAEATYGLVGVIGNDDLPGARALLAGEKVYNVHTSGVQLGAAWIVGLEGAPDTDGIGHVLSSEREIARHLRSRLARPTTSHAMLVSHTPPRGCVDDAVRFGSRQIGSTALATMCQQTRHAPEVVICGHAHLRGGGSGRLGPTRVINVASHDSPGSPIRYATFRWSINPGGRISDYGIGQVRLHEELERVHHIGNARGIRLVAAGITSLAALAVAEAAHVGAALGWRPQRAAPLIARAQALTSARPIPLGVFDVPLAPRVFFDIETDSSFGSRFVWLISCLDERTDELQQFLASTPRQMRRILREFAAYCDEHSEQPFVAYSGSHFDRNRLADFYERAHMPVPLPVEQSHDCLRAVERAIALPCDGFALKIAAACLGFRYRHPDMDGLQVALAYETAIERGKPLPSRLLEYAEDDVRSLGHLVREVARLTTAPGPS